jgi:hypothetical protein
MEALQRPVTLSTIRTFPSADRAFAEEVREILHSVPQADRGPRVLESVLRARYPNLTVTERHAMASLGDSDIVWYVFRDGHL